jgi:hypothetical protein
MTFLGTRALLPLALSVVVSAQAAPPSPPILPAVVIREPIDLAGFPEPHTPPQWNRVGAVRFVVPGEPVPATVVVLIPGLNSGPNTLDLFARALLTHPGPPLEVWAVKHRPSLLQDRRGIDASLSYNNPDFALGYYYGNLEIDGHTFQHRVENVPFAAYWGLDVHLRDIRAVVQEVHQRFPDAKVVLGGHSLGAILAALYAGYDFGRLPGPDPVPLAYKYPAPSPDSGALDISGLLMLDGIPLAFLPTLTPRQYHQGFWIPFIGRIPGIDSLTARDSQHWVGPFTDLPGFARTKDSILFGVIAVYAFLRPDEASYLPFPPRKGLPISNEALLGAVLSSDMQKDFFIRTSVGVAAGVFPRIPDPAHVNPRGLFDLAEGRPIPGQRLIHWVPYDERTPRPLVDLHALEAAILQPGADFTQWYTPWRLLLDLALPNELDTSDPFARQFASLTQVRYTRLPLLIIGGGEGLVRRPDATLFYRRHIATPDSAVSIEILKGFTHLDVEDAVINPAVPRILGWLGSVIH